MEFDSALLKELGLEDVTFEVVAQADWPSEDVGYGAGLLTPVTAAMLASLHFLPIGFSVATIGGVLSRADHPERIVRFKAAEPTVIRDVRTSSGREDGILSKSSTDVTVSIARTGQVVVYLSDGGVTVLQTEPTLRVARGFVLPVTPLADVPPFPVDAVMTGQDGWIADRVKFHLSIEDAWHNAVAAGLFLRLRETSSSEPLTWHASASWPHRWVSALTDDQRETVVARAKARLDGLWQMLEELEEELALDESDWLADFRDWCRDRDDLEGVRVLINWAGPDPNLEERIANFDSVASRFVRSIPRVLTLQDEQLRRAAIVSPMAWWTSCVDVAGRAK